MKTTITNNSKTQCMKTKTIFTIFVIALFGLFLTGCQQDDGESVIQQEQAEYSDQLLRFGKKTRIYDSSQKYWIDLQINSNAAEGINDALSSLPIIELLSQEEKELLEKNTNSSNEDMKYEDTIDNKSSLQISYTVIDSNIPDNIAYRTTIHNKQSSNSESNKVTYKTYTWINPTHRGVQTTVQGPYTIPIKYYNKSGIAGSWRHCGTITHYGPNYSYSFFAFATANPDYSTSNRGVKVSAYTTEAAALSIELIWLFPL